MDLSITAKIMNIATAGKRFITGTEWTDLAGKVRRSLDVNARVFDEDGNPVPVGSPTDPVNVATNSVTVVPTGTLITLDTDPTALPTTPLTGRKWIQFMNEDLVDIQLCDSAGVVFLTLEPGQKSEKYCASDAIDFYGKVATGTADVGVRVIEGK